jgi:hypothetical protein
MSNELLFSPTKVPSQWSSTKTIINDLLGEVATPEPHLLGNQVVEASTRVARWYIFQPKIPIWVNFGGSCNGRCWSILWPFGLFYGHWVNFVAIWYNFTILVCCTNLATLISMYMLAILQI